MLVLWKSVTKTNTMQLLMRHLVSFHIYIIYTLIIIHAANCVLNDNYYHIFMPNFFVFSGRTLTKNFTRNFMSPNSVEAPKKITKMEELNFNFHLINN